MSKLGYFPGISEKNNVCSFLEQNAENTPKREALRWVHPQTLQQWSGSPDAPLKHESVTMRAFADKIAHCAAGMAELGIRKGDRAILFVPMSLELYVAMSALQRLGAIPVFLDSWARRSHLGVSAQCVAPRAMISFEKAFELCKTVPEFAQVPIQICVGPAQGKYTARLEQLIETPQVAPITPVEREETALITFTTGSSGTPKGANRTHRFLAAQHYALDLCVPYGPGDIDLPVFPIFSLNNLAAGVTTVLPAIDVGVPSDRDALILLAQFQSSGVTCTTLSPSLLNGLSAYCIEKGLSLKTLRRVATGGAPISRDNLVDFKKVAPQAQIWVLYGSTEVEPMAHIEATEMIGFQSRAQTDGQWVDEGVNVGHMAEGLKYRFLKITRDSIQINKASDWERFEVPLGQVGELIVAGEHVCRDYYNNTEAFFRAKIRDENGVIWHRTGDIARLDEKGYLWIVGRVHNAIQRGGDYVFPVRAEMILKKLPFVHQAAYLGLPDQKLGEKTACVVVPKEKPFNQTKWESEIIGIMGKNEVPVDMVIFRDEIPMDPRHHSKVEYDQLRTQLQTEGLT